MRSPHVNRYLALRAGCKVPAGTTENSPRFQPWVASEKWAEPRRGERNDGVGPVRPFVPDGTRSIFAPQPSDESPGYFRASLRDVDSRHADENRFQAEPTFGTRMRGRAAQVPSLSKHHSQINSIDARKRMDGHCGDRFRLREPVRGRLCIGLCRGLDALCGDILPRSPRNFALLAEGPLDEIHKLQVGGSQRREIRRTRFARPGARTALSARMFVTSKELADLAVLAPEFTGGLSGDSPRNSATPAAAPISAPTAPTGRKSLRTPPRSTRAFRA